MDWIKIKTKHILNTRLTLLEIGALVKLQVLTAHLERKPTEKEITAILPHKVCATLAEVLHDQRTTLAEVLEKVCEDVAEVLDQRRTTNARKKKWRNKHKNNEDGTRGVDEGGTRKRREEKRRRDEIHTFTIPVLSEVVDYCKEKGYMWPQQKCLRFLDYYGATNWFRGKTKIRNWKNCVNTWQNNEEPQKILIKRKLPDSIQKVLEAQKQ